jgi:pyruvate dehydrogenase E2 component (dihydrolipoamide acetyltransferase)/2-oxoisovalerate dehydrogenase E2 component (dihydrolipoyl transacylase)
MDFALPELGEGVYEAELVAWLVKVGDRVKRGQNLMEVMTDKATMEVPSRFVGTITALNAAPGQQLKVGQVVLTYMPRDEEKSAEPVPATAVAAQQGNGPPAPAAASVAVGPSGRLRTPSVVKAAPSVRQMARKLGIDLGGVRGSGPEGRILIGDLTSLIQTRKPVEKTAPPEPRPEYGTPGTRIKLVGLRRKIAEHMAQAKHTVAHYSYVDECDVTELVRVREGLRDTYARAGRKLTYLAFAVKAVTAALKEVPIVNASLEEKAEEIVLHDRYHIGIAVATPGGLLVPVVRDADRKDLGQIAREIERLSTEARAGKARMEDLRGGTFTITSIGNIGGLFSTPVVNYPEVGILGLGKIVRRPVYDAAGNIRPADLLYLSFSFDHRVVDGAVGATFGNAVNRQLQNPLRLLLPEKFA